MSILFKCLLLTQGDVEMSKLEGLKLSTAKKPILDDFFEQNNLKHKQGYLQTLLDSAEAAGIFQFKREGNEILILRGPNYKAFLEGKVRRVTG